jgi:quercetin dioxygenase-like cupin family protein
MEINADFSQRAAVHASAPWVASPMPGVDRRMLDRIGGEVARATSIVRYAPGSAFSAHTHTGGEEFLVLEGVFQDEHGDYPAGTYVRNPPTTKHTPSSAPGCTIFVKLWQFDMADRDQFSVDLSSGAYTPVAEGVERLTLHREPGETVLAERWAPDTRVTLDAPEGMELLVLTGGFTEANEAFSAQSWLRLPPGTVTQAETGPDGATVWIKSGHLGAALRVPDLAAQG